MEQIKLSPRLNAIAEQIPIESSVADIGTDHGYIPVWLAQSGRYGDIAATDIRNGPLENAKKAATTYGVSKNIRFFLCCGLQFPKSDRYQTIVIAGMGGKQITSILQDAPWTRSGVTLILQPNSKINHLNEWLACNGYCVRNAKLVKDSGRIYQILVVSGGFAPSYTDAQQLVHPLYLEKHDPLLPEYLDTLIQKYTAAIAGMRHSQHEAFALQERQDILISLISMREETATWQL